jgi:hypothetical protein
VHAGDPDRDRVRRPPHLAIAALRAGAVGHIHKDVDPQRFASLVLRAAEGEAIIPQDLLMPLLELLRAIPERGWRPLHSRLTTREWEIVELLGRCDSSPHTRAKTRAILGADVGMRQTPKCGGTERGDQ